MKIRKSMCWVLMVVMLSSFVSFNSFAAESLGDEEGGGVVQLEAVVSDLHRKNVNPDISTIETDFVEASITVSRCEEGMHITIANILNEEASIIGVKDIKIKHKVWWGWETVATSSGGYVNNSGGMSVSLTYSGAVDGDTYRITCVFYGNVDEYRELNGDSGEFKFSF